MCRLTAASSQVQRFSCLTARGIESRMATNLEMHLFLTSILHMPDDMYLVTVKAVTHCEIEGEGKDLQRLFAVVQGKDHLVVRLSHKGKVCVAGKSMTRQMILFPIHTVSVIVDATHDGEEDG